MYLPAVSTSDLRLPVLSSPRMRRRIGWTLAGVAAFAAVVVTVALLPSGHSSPERLRPTPKGEAVATPKPLHLTRVDRRAISSLLARFVPAALGREDLTAAYRLASPTMRLGMSLEEWRRGDIPVFPYRAALRGFDGWRLNLAQDEEVSLDLLLHSAAGNDRGSITYTFDVRRLDGRWYVDSAVPTATYAPVHEGGGRMLAQPDFGPDVPNSKVEDRRLDASWLILPAIVLGLVVLVPVFFGLRHWRRSVLAYRRGVAERR
jgi:hypothetical protein